MIMCEKMCEWTDAVVIHIEITIYMDIRSVWKLPSTVLSVDEWDL